MDLSPDHYVNLKNGRFDSTTPQQLDDAFAKWDAAHAAGTHKPLILHFHGGLVNEKDGMGVAKRLLPFYLDSGSYPLFFVWEAGAIEVLRHNLSEIFDERFFKRLLSIVVKFVIGKLNDGDARGVMLELPSEAEIQAELRLAPRELSPAVPREVPFEDRAATELPEDAELTPAQEQQLRMLIASDTTLAAEIQAILNSRRSSADVAAEAASARGGTIRTVSHSLIDDDVVRDIEAEIAVGGSRGLFGLPIRVVKGAVLITARVIARFARRRDHGVYATIVEEILREFYVGNAGQLIWGLMKGDTKDAFGAGADQFGGTRLLERLHERFTADPTRSVTLVGHSTGAVYISNLLQAAKNLPAGAQFDVLFLAPANTFELMAETLATAKARIRNIRIFGMQDAVERKDRLVPVVYPHSLLYFVSGVCEKGNGSAAGDTPIVGLERYYANRKPYQNDAHIQAVVPFLSEGGRKHVWSIADTGLGFASDASKHGEFDNFEDDNTRAAIRPTGASVRHILQKGYV